MVKNIKNKPKTFQKENPIIFKAKKHIRDFYERKIFYSTHSKFATYIDPDYLKIFKQELISFTKAFYRLFGKNMDPERNPGIEGHANTRGLHSLDVSINSEISGKNLLLNEELLAVGGLIHDLGHSAFAHDGEKIISDYLKQNGIGEIHHPVVEWLTEMSSEIHERTIEGIEVKKGRKLTQKELEKYNEYRYIITDIAAAHNGEGVSYEIIANLNKTTNEIKQQIINAFTEKGANKKIRSKTVEGAIVRFEDVISYVAKDFRHGIISKMIEVNDEDYEKIFIELGISKENLDMWAKGTEKKDKIVRKVTNLLMEDLEKNSMGLNGARMSEEMSGLMFKLRELNYKKVTGRRTRKIMDILPNRIPKLIDRYSEILMKYEKTGKKDDEINSYRTNMRRNITKKQSEEVKQAYEEIVKTGIEKSVRREINEIVDGIEPNEENKEYVTKRRKRFETDIKMLQKNGEITEAVKEGYIQRILNEIYLTPEESKKLLDIRIKKLYPSANSMELQTLAKENEYLRVETYEEALAKFKVAMYVGGSSNDYLLDMLEEEKLLKEEEKQLRYEYGGDSKNSAVGDTMKNQAEERREMQQAEQEER